MKPLIAYYSRRGQNLVNGTVRELRTGNTELLASVLQRLTDADSFRIEPREDYPTDYYRCIDEARQDLQKHRCPPLKTLPDSLADYDVIYLGYPNYWGTVPMPVVTFLKHFDFSGKRIKPFCTHEGSGLGRSEQDIQALCPGAQVEAGLAIRGRCVKQELTGIEEWVQQDHDPRN